MNQNILDKITQIKTHPLYHDDRCIRAIFRGLENGDSIHEEDALFVRVREEYSKGKHYSPSQIKYKFKKTMKFIHKNFSEFYA